MHQQFIYIKKSYDSVRMEVLHNILIAFGIPNKNVWIKPVAESA